jgi:hypothetical protein
MPTLLFQVYSSDWLGRHRLEGYGYHHLSDRPGSCDVEIKTWRPVGKIRDQMRDFFLGNAVYLKDEQFVDSVNKTAAALNRFGVLTQSSGSVRLRVHTIVTDPRTILDHHRESAAQQQQADSSLKVRRTVNDILQSFRASSAGTPSGRLSVSSSAAGLMASLGTPGKPAGKGDRPSVANIMGSLNSSARDAKVNEILARARAKTGKGAAGGGSLKPEGIAAAPRPTLGPPTVAAMDRLRNQLPSSTFGAGARAPVQDAPGTPITPGTPHTPSPVGAVSTVYTPFVVEQRQQARPKNVPPLGGIGAHAEGRPGLAPLVVSGGTTGRSGASGAPVSSSRAAGSALASALHTGRGEGHQPIAALLEPDDEPHETAHAPPQQLHSARPSTSEPTTARKHRYDTPSTPVDDDDHQALLGDTSRNRSPPVEHTPADEPQREAPEHSARSGDVAESVDSLGPLRGFQDEEEPPEDAPLLATMQLNKG